MSSSDALLNETQTMGKLYDEESMRSVKESIAQGFIVLLGGVDGASAPSVTTTDSTKKSKKKKKKKSKTPDKDVALAFLALIQGNVLDACFGVAHPSRGEDSPATRAARDAKLLLDEAATTDTFRVCAVEAYCEAFRAILTYRTQYDKLNCITRCFRAKKLRTVCDTELRESFLNLAKAIAEQR